MSMRAAALSAFVVLCLASACETEVTVHLLRDRNQASEAGEAGHPDEEAAGATGVGGAILAAGAGGEAGSAGEEGVTPPEPCKKLGSEVCNGGDDDCDGVLDGNCELTVRWSPQPDTATMGHSTGGFTFAEPCADGSLLVGFRVGMGKWLNQVAALCRQIELHTDTTDAGPSYSYTLGPWYDRSLAPASSDDDKNTLRDLSCPDDTVLTGVQGTVSDDDSRYIEAIRISCAPPLVTGSSGAEVLDSDRSREKWFGPYICSGCPSTPVYNYSMTIPKGRVAGRLFGGVGKWVDRVGFGASRASIVAK